MSLKSGAQRNRTDDMGFDCDCGGRSGRCCQLWIESGHDPVGALGRKGGRWIEQPEIAWMCHVNQPVFHLRNHPRQNRVHRKWVLEVEFAEFPSEGAQIEGRRDWAAHDSLRRLAQRTCQKIVQALASLCGRE